jgi:hypothetical protein
MPLLLKSSPPNAPDTLSVEERMRRALGLTGDRAVRSSPPQAERPQAGPPGRAAGRSSADKPRHRFVQDGAVPVTILNRHRPDEAEGSPASRTAIEAALRDERAARDRAERSLQEALATVRDLQTKLGHAELAHREALATAQAARAEADALRAEHGEQALRWTEDLAAERAARAAAEAALAGATHARAPAKRTRVSAPAAQPALDLQDASPASVAKAPAKPAAKRTRKAASEPGRREPEPVKWWLRSVGRRWP